MKKLFSFIITLSLSLVITASNACAADETFSDIDGHWAESTILKFKDMNILSGYPDGTFKPDGSVTRAEFAKIIVTAFDLDEKTSLEEYTDLNNAEWYYPYIECAAKYIPVYALPVGYETNLPYTDNIDGFLPSTNAIRMHVAEALVKIELEKDGVSVELPDINTIQSDLLEKFKDADYEELFVMHGTVPDNVRRMFEYTWLASELGIMQGNSDGYFLPYSNVTRAEVITMIDRMISE